MTTTSSFRNTFLFVLALTFMVSCKQQPKEASPSGPPPNIIFIMSDDHAYQAISAYGHGLNETPHIDRIAKEGMLFDRAFVSNSICAPSRAVMLTGKHSHINGKTDNHKPFDWDQDNVAKQLQANGYQTALVGKIHLHGTPQGFDYYNILPGQGQYYNPDFIENGVKKRIPGYVTNITTDIALDWLETKRDTTKPFLLLYHQKAPHRTWMPEAKYLDRYDAKKFTPPANYKDDYEDRPAAAQHEMGIMEHMGLVYDLKMLDKEETIEDPRRKHAQNMYDRMDSTQRTHWDAHYQPIIEKFLADTPEGDDLAQWKFERYMQDYLSTIQSVDDGVGQVLDYLKENGLEENTIVIYTSDQGFYLGEHGWFDKRFMYEESFRTPLLIKYPKEIKAGGRSSDLVQNLDFAATFLDYAGAPIPEDNQGLSLRKITKGDNTDWRDALYYTYYEHPSEHNVHRHYGVRTDGYKLIHFYHGMDHWELYDLKNDPQEMRNEYGNEAFADIRTQLHQKLDELKVLYKDSVH